MGGEQHPDETQALLAPFYVSGALAADERARIEAALPGDADLRAEVEAARELSATVKAGGAALAAEIARRPARVAAVLARIAARERRRPAGAWKEALAACLAAAAVVQAGVVGWRALTHDRYETLSGPAAAANPAAELVVRLKPEAPWGEVEALLSAQGLEIVGGPRDQTLELAAPADLDAAEAVRRLRASPLVDFAGPAS